MTKGGSRARPSGGALRAVAIFVFGGLVGGGLAALVERHIWYQEIQAHGLERHSEPVDQDSARYAFISPLVECMSTAVVSTLEFSGLEERMRTVITAQIAAGRAEDVAAYFRDLNNGPWYGVNEDAQFLPGSLLKVPLMMGWLAVAEQDRSWMQRPCTVAPELMRLYDVQSISPAVKLEPGGTYRIEELIERAIVYSDNVAASLLETADQGRSLKQVAGETGVRVGPELPRRKEISIKEYASLLRMLYNASYLNLRDSNWALELLARADFKDGLRAGIPAEVPVAHKFGEAALDGRTTTFSHCGIVYVPGRPYLLCLAATGRDETALIGVVRDLSAWVYAQVTG